jgi:hypothetical protein
MIWNVPSHERGSGNDSPVADYDSVDERRANPNVRAASDPRESTDIHARADRHVVADLDIVPNQRSAIDQHMPTDSGM